MTKLQKEAALKMRDAGTPMTVIAEDLGLSLVALKAFYGTGEKIAQRPESGNCKWCGKEFTVPRAGREKQFCSRLCYNQWWHAVRSRRTEYNRVCPTCGKAFTVQSNKKQKYCSADCYHASRKAGGERE